MEDVSPQGDKKCSLRSNGVTRSLVMLLVGGAALWTGGLDAAEVAKRGQVPVVDGVVVARRPVLEAIAEAMQFLKRADGGYVPGRIDGELAGYFTRAHVNEDGSRSERQLAFPARQHAYFIFTFLRYHAYSGQRERLLRARDLADWNLAHSTPADAFYRNLPYSVFTNGKPGGSQDKDSIEPDKGAFLGSAYVALYEATKEEKYLAGAKAIAQTLAHRQNADNPSRRFASVLPWRFCACSSRNARSTFGRMPSRSPRTVSPRRPIHQVRCAFRLRA